MNTDTLIRRLFTRLLGPKRLDKLGRSKLNRQPTLIFLSRNSLINDLGFSDKQVSQLYSNLNNRISAFPNNLFWVNSAGKRVKSHRSLPHDFKTIASVSGGRVSIPFNKVKLIVFNEIKAVAATSKKTKDVIIEAGHLTKSAIEEGVSESISSAKNNGTFGSIVGLGATEDIVKKSLRNVESNRSNFVESNLAFEYSFEHTRKLSADFASNNGFNEEMIVTIIPQTKESNLLLAVEERKVGGIRKEIEDVLTAKGLLDRKGSPSDRQLIQNAIANEILGKKGKKSFSASKKMKGSSKAKVKVKSRGFAPTKESSKLRNAKGQFTTLFNIQNLLNEGMEEAVAKNMGKSSDPSSPKYLRYQTGTLARSVKITRINRPRDNLLTLFYTFQKIPYDEAYGPGGKRFTEGRNPRRFITKSIRELATKITVSKFGLLIRRDGHVV